MGKSPPARSWTTWPSSTLSTPWTWTTASPTSSFPSWTNPPTPSSSSSISPYNKRTRFTSASQVSIFVGKDFLVTVHSGDLKPLVNLFKECQEKEERSEER